MRREKLTQPPKLAAKLLHIFLRDDLLEEVSGDLEENFNLLLKNRRPWRAKMKYWYQVLHYVRPFAIRKIKSPPTNSMAMYSSYFKVGFRSLLKNRGYSFINITGLAVGLTIALLIGLWVYDELTYDRYHQNYDRVVQVMQHQTQDGNTSSQLNIPMPLGEALREEHGNDLELLSLCSWTNEHILTTGDKSVKQYGNFAEPAFSQLFSLEMVQGSSKALQDPSSILISQSAAKALFGTDDPIEKAIRIDGKLDAKIAGVYKDIPGNTTFQNMAFIAPWEMYLSSDPFLKKSMTRWSNNSFQLFGQLAEGADLNVVSEKIKRVKYNHAVDLQRFNPEVYLHPMSKWHLRSNWENGVNTGGQIRMVWLFGIIGVFVLLLACINFMNLSTARSEKRAKEVGIRMTIGSVRSQLINQFLSESFLVVLLSFVVALGLTSLSLPLFNELAAKQIVLPWSIPYFWIASAVFVILTSLLAGSYPALYLSSFKPVNVLKGTFKAGRFASLPRKVLVVVQFTVSVTLVIGTTIVYRQIMYSQDRPAGYDRNALVMIQKKTPEFEGKFAALQTELLNHGVATQVAEASSPMFSVWAYNGGFLFEGLDPEFKYSDFGTIWISPEFGSTVGWKITEGRDFSRAFSTDSMSVIINETALQYLGMKDPIGKEVKWGDDVYHIAGVVEDMIMESPYQQVKPHIYFCSYEDNYWYYLRLSPDKTVQQSMVLLEATCKKLFPSAPFDYRFADEAYASKFAAEVRMGKLTTVFSVLAILISSLGIFGLASFVAEQRTKEIGIRKVMGASISSLWQMLSKEFIILVLIASLLAVPLAIWFLADWLKGYQYRTEISWWIPFLSVLGALLITITTVSYQAIRAARMNPVKSLRSE